MTKDHPVSFFHASSSDLFDGVFPAYKDRSKSVLQLIKRDKSLSRFDAFNTRLKMACGLQISFSDNLDIVRPDTRACYALMYRITDVWYAFEHLLDVAKDEIPRASKSNIKPYNPDTFAATGLSAVELHFGHLVAQHVTAEASWRRELYPMLAYFINNTEKGTQKALRECLAMVKTKQPFRFQDLLALSYGLRILYVHEGVMAAMGTRNYALKRRLYEVLLDSLTLASFTLGSEYARRVIAKWQTTEAAATATQQSVAADGPLRSP